MKTIIITLTVFLFAINCKSQDIRNCKWGMTKKQVLSIEKSKLSTNSKDYLSYDVNMDGDPYALIYNFKNDSLISGMFIFSPQQDISPNTYYEYFLRISNKLKIKYGQLQDMTKWKNDLYKGDIQNYGNLVSIDHVDFEHVFMTEKTKIMLQLVGENYGCNLGIIYKNLNYSEEEKTEF